MMSQSGATTSYAQLAPVVHSILGWVLVPQMWAFVPRIVVLAKLIPGPATVEQVVHKKLWFQTRTSFLYSPKFGFGRQHWGWFLVVVVLQVVSDGAVGGGRHL